MIVRTIKSRSLKYQAHWIDYAVNRTAAGGANSDGIVSHFLPGLKASAAGPAGIIISGHSCAHNLQGLRTLGLAKFVPQPGRCERRVLSMLYGCEDRMAAGALRKPFRYYSMRVACGVLLALLTLLTREYHAGGATASCCSFLTPCASPLLSF